jgi:glutamine amidotransferase
MSRTVAIVDCGMGNLFSIRQACRSVGLEAIITSSRSEIQDARAVILPGVGAFRDAMESLKRHDLVGLLRDIGQSDTPLVGICLGLQLLMRESEEFGHTPGLGIVDGDVVRLPEGQADTLSLKVPHVGWSRVYGSDSARWENSVLEGVEQGAFMYFVHSFYARPQDTDVIIASTRYGTQEVCAALVRKNVFACQFHPERSGASGLRLYANLATRLTDTDMAVTGHQN